MSTLLKWFRRHEIIAAASLLSIILFITFSPVLVGGRTLMFSASAVSSIMPYGAFYEGNALKPEPLIRSPDPAAPGWQTDAWIMFLHNQVFGEHCFPLWNPYSGLGMPLLANMQSQPLFPLFWLPALNPCPTTMDLFALLRLAVAGIFGYMFMRQLTTRASALLGAIAFMFTGYLILLMNMPEISVAITTPLVFLSFERLVRNPTCNAVVLAAIASALNLLGGMPELSALIMIFAGLYFVLRLSITRRTFKRKLKSIMGLASASLLGLAIAAPQVLPFLEYLKQSFNSHDPNLGVEPNGIGHDGVPWWPHLMKYVLPCDAGAFIFHINEPIPPVNRGYFGIIITFLALSAVLSLVRRFGGTTKRQRLDSQVILPLILFVVFALLKRWGNPLVNWIGALPIFDMILFAKYDEPLIGFAMVVIALVGLRWIRQGGSTLADIIGPALILAGACILWKLQEPHVHASKRAAAAYAFDLYFYFGILVSTTILLVLLLRLPPLTDRFAKNHLIAFSRKEALYALVLLTAFEMSFNFIVPIFFLRDQLPSKACNPYTGAPYIRYIKEHTTGHERVFAYDTFLHPCWSSAFGLCDVRALDAMYVGRFLPFIRNFLYGEPKLPTYETSKYPALYGDNASNRFVGTERGLVYPTEIKRDSLLNRLLVLSSVKHLVTNRYFMNPTPEMKAIADNNKRIPKEYLKIRKDFFLQDGNKLCVLHQHPLGKNTDENRAIYSVTIDRSKPFLVFGVGLDPMTPGQGDGANVYIKVLDSTTEAKVLFTQLVKPGPDAYAFKPHVLDLTSLAGKTVTLEFSVDGGPLHDELYDWVAWSGIHFVANSSHTEYWSGSNECNMKMVYEKECMVFEQPKVLSRASLFRRVEVTKDGDAALAKMREPDFDVFSTAVVEHADFTNDELSLLNQLTTTKSEGEATCQAITRYGAHDIEVSVDSPGGLLVLNDANYPGWVASIDEKPAQIRRTNYLFRGVFVPAGRHSVTFRYEAHPFYIGLALFSIASAVVTLLLIRYRRRRPKAIPNSIKEAAKV